MLQPKRIHAEVFRQALDGEMERRTRIYLKLTMPLFSAPEAGTLSRGGKESIRSLLAGHGL